MGKIVQNRQGFMYVQWVAFSSILHREVRRFTRIWQQTLLPPAITMSLYFAIFGTLIGSRVGQMAGFDYMSFIVPGLIMMSVITGSYGNVSSSFFSHKFQHSIEELMIAPVHPLVILLGYVCGGVVRGLMVSVIVTLISMYFTELKIHNMAVVISIIILTAVLFSLAGLINAVFAKSFDDISIIPTFVIAPMTYLGGVFYSISLMSEFWQGVSKLNPILYMVNTFRYGMLGYSDVDITTSYLILLAFIVVLSLIAVKLMQKRENLRL